MMQGIRAVYDLTEIRETRGAKRAPGPRPTVSNPASRPGILAIGIPLESTVPTQRERLETLSEMLDEHFAEEVRVRDHDGDGRLNHHEYGGTPEEFKSLDHDGDGLVGARDMVREALARNDSLRVLVQGQWAPVYDGFLLLDDPSADDLEAAAFGLCGENKLDFDEFLAGHPDLTALHARLNRLADRLGRQRRYHPVDLSG